MQRLLAEPRLEAPAIVALLERVCFGVVLTKDEDRELSAVFPSAMPPGWSIDDLGADPFARYKHPDVQLYRVLHPPAGRRAAPDRSGDRPATPPAREVVPGAAPAAVADPWDPAATLEVIARLEAEHGLRNAQFKRLHHGKRPSLANHVAYCENGGRFTTESNVRVCQRLLECLVHLEQGASWDEAIDRALERYPLERGG
jgi:hypothetical protein